jgi:HPt (histidine-containing phosphotransfer) domain-containing protein
MIIDYDKWREGEPYDIAALAEITPEERDQLTEEICANGNLDWRDVEALKALNTPKALKRIAHTAKTQGASGGAEALVTEIETKGWSKAAEKQLIAQLENMKSMESSSDRLFDLCEQHQTPAVMEQLMRNARIQSDETMRYACGEFLLYLTGHIDHRYAFDKEHRPHLLDLNSDDYKTYKAAVAWLEEKVANPKKK